MSHPVIPDAPGLVWRPLKSGGWMCRWQCRSDLAKAGFRPSSCRIWAGKESDLTGPGISYIQSRANALQNEMLIWSRGGLPATGTFDGTLRSLINCYQTDPDSSHRKLRYGTRRSYDSHCKRLADEHGHEAIADIKARTLLRWHETWGQDGKVAMSHALIGMIRTLVGFGMTILESDECARLAAVMSKMRFKMGKPRSERLTADQVDLIRAEAHRIGLPSLALAQALQFDLMLRQKDVIGEWVPISEPGASEITYGNEKWLRGLRWNEIDQNMILTHTTSKRQKEIVVDLKLAPMVMEEINKTGRKFNGPVVIFEKTGTPYTDINYRRRWRELATAVGVPKSVRNMDTRSGAISEATDAGIDLEHVRHMATHTDIAMTQRYSRGSTDKVAAGMVKRAEFRNKTGK